METVSEMMKACNDWFLLTKLSNGNMQSYASLSTKVKVYHIGYRLLG